MKWLTRVFGFREHYRYGEADEPSGAQLFAGNACIMLHRAKDHPVPAQLGFGTQSLTVFVNDVEEHCRRARAGGAQILEEPHETVYGEFQYAVLDLDGHHWLFSQHVRDLAPEDWGAKVSTP